jgi:transmembrane sensor
MKQDIKELLTKFRNGTISKFEIELLETWYLKWTPEPKEISMERLDELEEEIYAKLPVPLKQTKLWPRIAVAASITMACTICGYLYYSKQHLKIQQTSSYVNDIQPGKVGATLTLSNGRQIRLTDTPNGEVAKEAGISVTKMANGQLVYKFKGAYANPDGINTLSTAKGETYILTLPDQSKVWLNAASSLTYSTGLNVHGMRRVELSGEAYFEISKDKMHPFIVKSLDQEVRVLGTHFNISAYPDEKIIKTTLLEGSVNINSSETLKPGQLAINNQNKITVHEANSSLETAWIENYFAFKDESAESVMRKLSRWYNVTIIYPNENVKLIRLNGHISRTKSLGTVLERIGKAAKLNFTIKGRNVTVEEQ